MCSLLVRMAATSLGTIVHFFRKYFNEFLLMQDKAQNLVLERCLGGVGEYSGNEVLWKDKNSLHN